MIGILDFNAGNTGSILSSLKRIGLKACLVKDIDSFEGVEKFIIPGVGHFDFWIQSLCSSSFFEAFKSDVLEKKKHVLGICSGAQIFGHESDEGKKAGLGWIDMNIKKFPNMKELRVPHIGWESVTFSKEDSLFSGVHPEKNRFYFTHSYYFSPRGKNCEVSARTFYGVKFPSIVRKDNIIAAQFHPEKSHGDGLAFLRNFCEL